MVIDDYAWSLSLPLWRCFNKFLLMWGSKQILGDQEINCDLSSIILFQLLAVLRLLDLKELRLDGNDLQGQASTPETSWNVLRTLVEETKFQQEKWCVCVFKLSFKRDHFWVLILLQHPARFGMMFASNHWTWLTCMCFFVLVLLAGKNYTAVFERGWACCHHLIRHDSLSRLPG